MESQFVDRILTCSDCHGEFIFTAGEQLFFNDKQFKNDPKRCKPCKSRRSGLSAAANGTGPAAAGISRTETRTECSECGIQTTVPFKPTQGRPVLCRQCFQLKSRAAAPPSLADAAPAVEDAGLQPPAAISTPAETVSALTAASADSNGRTLSASAAQVAAASMASASPESSVATAADLASISNLSAAAPTAAAAGPASTHVSSGIVAAARADSAAASSIPAELGDD